MDEAWTERDTTVNEARETAILIMKKMFWIFEFRETRFQKRGVLHVQYRQHVFICYSLMLPVFLAVFVYKIPQMCKYSISLPNSLEI